jgi:dTMP kinase
MFITFEGGEGSGKSTQSSLLVEFLVSQGRDAIKTREPGGSAGAEEIRKLLVSGSADRWSPKSEALLMFASRADHVENLIAPALSQGTWVVCDRFADSSFAYQGYGRGIPISFLEQLYTFAVGPYAPNLTFILDIDPSIGLERAYKRQNEKTQTVIEGRFESFDIDFHKRVRQGFLDIAAKQKKHAVVIDATLPIAEIQDEIRQRIMPYLKD